MGEYANVKRRKMMSLLKWLSGKNDVEVRKGGKHTYVVKYVFWEKAYPIPFKHNEVNKYIIKDLMEKLTGSGICSKEEFDEYIK